MVFRGSGTHARRAVAVVMAGAARRRVGVMEGPTGAPLAVAFQAFLGSKKKFRPSMSRKGLETDEGQRKK
jgi:hypothetical protein